MHHVYTHTHTHTHTHKLSGMLPTGYVGSLENESYPTSEEEEEEELEEEELEEDEESGTINMDISFSIYIRRYRISLNRHHPRIVALANIRGECTHMQFLPITGLAL